MASEPRSPHLPKAPRRALQASRFPRPHPSMSVSPWVPFLAVSPSVIPKAGNPCTAIPILRPPTKTVPACGPPTTPGSPTAATPPDPAAHPAGRARSSWFFLHCLKQRGQHTISRLKARTRHEAEAHSPFPAPTSCCSPNLPSDHPTSQHCLRAPRVTGCTHDSVDGEFSRGHNWGGGGRAGLGAGNE